jgi:hypothetical protein
LRRLNTRRSIEVAPSLWLGIRSNGTITASFPTSGRVRQGRAVLCSVIATFLPAVATAQNGTVAGRVTQAETGAPLAGVAVIVAGAGRGALTDTAGRFTIAELAPRSYRLQARRQGYQEQERLVPVRTGETTFVSLHWS